MSRLYQRLKGAVQKNIYSLRQSYDPYTDSYNEERMDELDENNNDVNDYVENVRNDDNRSQRTTFRNKARRRTPSDENPPTTSPELRTVPNNIQPNLPSNNNLNTNINPVINTNAVPISNPPVNMNTVPISNPPVNINTVPISNPPVNINTVPISNPPVPTDLPPQDPTSHPPINPNQTPQPTINPVPQPSIRGGIPPSALNRKRRPFRINPNSTLVGFPHNLNSQSSSLNRPSFSLPQSRLPFPSRFAPSPRQNNMSNMQIDYPIENVLIDGDIPSSIAIKINEAVEHDRFGNTYYTHHYAYQPKTQHIAIGSKQQMERRLIGNSYPTGFRYIREIPYPQQQNLNNIQLMIDNTPELNSFPFPIYHFTAHASANDPMRYY